jgi:hypothetical protein
MRRWLAAVGWCGLALATACTGGAKPHALKPMLFDGGALELQPVAHGHPAISRAVAAHVAITARSDLRGQVIPMLAAVTTRVTANQEPASTVPNFTSTLAWVYLTHPNVPPASCPAPLPSRSPRPATPPPTPSSGIAAVIVDGRTGVGFSYESAGVGSCGGLPAPGLWQAQREESVPWTLAGHIGVRIAVPPCGQLDGFSTGGRWSEATALVPDAPCRGNPAERVMRLDRRPTTPAAPIGPICSGLHDPAVPDPSDCVSDNSL